jgi:Leucine-rich repeat (LRR) protein
MESVYFDFLPIDIIYIIITKLGSYDLNNYLKIIKTVDINWEYIATLVFNAKLKNFKKEFPIINKNNYLTILTTYKLKETIKEFNNMSLKNIYNIKNISLPTYIFYKNIKDIASFPHLKSISFIYDCDRIPQDIKLFTNLENLLVKNYYPSQTFRLTEIPRPIKSLVNLKTLKISGTNLSYIPEEVGQLISLEELNLSKNKIEVLPKEIGQLINLKKLNLSKNEIEILPKEIGNLINLEKINLSYNKIEVLPEGVFNLVKLKKINLSYNKIKALPKFLGNPTIILNK